MFRRNKTAVPDPGTVYEDLRAKALAAVESGLLSPDPEHPNVLGVVVDIRSDGAWATIVALADGTTSMYTSSGGGTIGAGAHESVRKANELLLTVIEAEVLPHLDPDPGTHPGAGYVRFHVLGPEGLSGIDVPDARFWGERGAGGNLVDATQYLIHTISTVSPPR